MSPTPRRPVLAVTVLVLVALLTAAGVASAAGRQAAEPAAPARALVPTVVPAGRVASLVSTPTVAPMSVAARSASTTVARNRPPCAITARACVDLSARKAWLTDGAGVVLLGPVGVLGGRKGEPTPVGTFTVSKKVRDYHSRQFDAPMPYSVFFYPGVAFHTGSLSTRSAGCLHLANASAKRFFAELAPGDQVQIIN